MAEAILPLLLSVQDNQGSVISVIFRLSIYFYFYLGLLAPWVQPGRPTPVCFHEVLEPRGPAGSVEEERRHQGVPGEPKTEPPDGCERRARAVKGGDQPGGSQ